MVRNFAVSKQARLLFSLQLYLGEGHQSDREGPTPEEYGEDDFPMRRVSAPSETRAACFFPASHKALRGEPPPANTAAILPEISGSI